MNSGLVDNKYEKLERLGTGGSGTVWKARNVVDDYYCAIKILEEPVDDLNSTAWKAFVKEFQLMRRAGSFGHPGIPQLYNIGLCNQEAYIEMSYYKGDSIYDILKKETILPFNQLIPMFQDILSTMAYLHYDIYKDLMNAEDDKLSTDLKDGRKINVRQEDIAKLVEKYSIVHNDIHSKQFVRNHYNGHYVLLDFGLAIQGKKAVRKTLINAGTPGYSAPEKVKGKEPDSRTDVFAIGALMFECLTGDVPYPDDDFEGKLAAIDERRSYAFGVKFPGKALTPEYMCPKWLSDIVLKCLSFDPSHRYPNAKALLADFEAKLNDYVSKRENGHSVQEQDIIDQQRRLMEAKDRRITSQQELISDNEQQIARLDAMVKKTESELKATLKKMEILGAQKVAAHRSRNIGWVAAIVLAVAMIVGFYFKPAKNHPDNFGTVSRLEEKVGELTDSLSNLLAVGRSKDIVIAKSRDLQTALEQKIGDLQSQLADEGERYEAAVYALRDSLNTSMREYAVANRRIAELEKQKSNTTSASAATTVVIGRSNNGNVVSVNNGTVNIDNQALKRELATCRETIDSLSALVSRYKAELANMAKNF